MDSKPNIDDEKKKEWVRDRYGKIAQSSSYGCDCSSQSTATGSSCCGSQDSSTTDLKAVDAMSNAIGYDIEDLTDLPEGANLGLGCGNPTALASLEKGEVVLDLGSGAGIDSFIASRKVGETGKVIGVDMTPNMVQKARENAFEGQFENVEFRLGEIEHLPVADNSVDVIISNCVINLVPDKSKVFAEAFRVLKPGGRIMISDIVLLKKLPDHLAKSVEAYTGCVSGAVSKEKYLNIIKNAGFSRVDIVKEVKYPVELVDIDASEYEDAIASIGVQAVK
ncbi:MAG: arsenite methyltransferase [Candidatus Hodarchaeales archaeon]|jgi:SAM-dependent methyltransferase